ncbi:MAG: hypothetical protein KAG06_06535 [Methylococcales bacterium]|nr:hypothetical protein [Methylococcales bacterium]
MKKLNGIIALSLFSLSCLSQVETIVTPTVSEAVEKTTEFLPQNELIISLKTALESYKRVLLSGEIEKSLDYAYPPIFNITSKESILQELASIKNRGKSPQIVDVIQSAELPIKLYSKGVYTTINFTMDMRMDMTPIISEDNPREAVEIQAMLQSPQELTKFKKYIRQMLKMSMGAEAEISFQEASLVVSVKKQGSHLAINEDDNGWKFIDLSPIPFEQAKGVLPDEIIKEMRGDFKNTHFVGNK